jgi:hypothetical protein
LRTGCTTAALTVNYTVGGTASVGADYTELGNSVTFAAGSAAASKTVSVIDDTSVDSDETVVLTLASGNGYTVGSSSSATVIIQDDDLGCTQTAWVTGFTPGTLRNDLGGWRGNRFEVGASAMQVLQLGRVFINGNTQDHELRLVRVSDNAVVASVNWTPAGGVHNEIKYVPLSAPVTLEANTRYYLASLEVAGRDNWYSYNTAVTTTGMAAVQTAAYSSNGVSWSAFGAAGSFSHGPVSVTYCDKPAPVVSVVAADATAGEPGTGQGAGVFMFYRTGPTSSDLTVNFARTGSATSGSDFASIGTTVTFAAGLDTATKNVDVIDDSIVEANETVTVILAGGAGYSIGTPSTATVTIRSDDLPVVTVTASDSVSGEPGTGQGNGVFRFSRTGPTTSTLTVNFTRTGTATSGSDFNSIGTAVTFAVGSATATKTVVVLDDTAAEADETVRVALASGTGYVIGTSSAATVTIKSDDLPRVTVVATDATAGEPGTSEVMALSCLAAPGRLLALSR